jgi:hypothetical protein
MAKITLDATIVTAAHDIIVPAGGKIAIYGEVAFMPDYQHPAAPAPIAATGPRVIEGARREFTEAEIFATLDQHPRKMLYIGDMLGLARDDVSARSRLRNIVTRMAASGMLHSTNKSPGSTHYPAYYKPSARDHSGANAMLPLTH